MEIALEFINSNLFWNVFGSVKNFGKDGYFFN